jgi:hypothetical protein
VVCRRHRYLCRRRRYHLTTPPGLKVLAAWSSGIVWHRRLSCDMYCLGILRL